MLTYAVCSHNRLIGLITRAGEVMREMDDNVA